MGQFLQKLKMPSTRPSTTLITLLLVAFVIFVLGGGIYDIMENPPSILPSSSNPIFYYQGMSEQTLNESAYFIIFLIMSVSGGYLILMSSRMGYRPREAKMLLLFGIAMMLIATTFSEVVLNKKIS